VIRKAHDRLNRVVAQEPLCDACHWLASISGVRRFSVSTKRP
jgi:hypothetical protein